MPAIQPIKARQVSSMGESPAEARRRMESGGASTPRPQGKGKQVAQLTAEHMAAIREADEGFRPLSGSSDEPEEVAETTEPPTPSKAMEVIRQLSQDKLQLAAERDAALNLIERYEAQFGELD